MPEGLTVPAWYNDNNYINEKVNECNNIKFGAVEGEEFTPWTAETVRDFIAGVNNEASYSPWMGYDNFVESGNAENCSPNPLFNVMQYVTAKANQLNSLNDGAGYGDHANNWTAQLVLDYFNAHDITAWDHFTTAGQFEGVNPSNAMDLSEFLAKKAAQCNEMKFDNREDWDEQAVLDYYQQHGINAVMVAVSDSDPNVVAVPEADQVTPPVGITPWGMATMPVDVELTTGVDVMPSNDAPINYVGTVANFNSTLNPNDQISGGNGNDKLTVNMDGSWGGFENGFVKDVPTVNLVNGSEGDTPFTWNAEGTTGVDNYEIDGYVNLENLPQTGITVDYSNINNRGAGNALINFASTGASDDALNINLGKNVGWLNFQTSGVETITLNSNDSAASLNTYADGMNNLVLKGDAVYNIRTMTLTTKSLDMSDLTSDGNFVCLSRSEGVNSIIGGSGNDSVSVRNLTPNAVIDGGDGEDSVKLRSSVGSFQWDMKNVETLNVAMAANLDIEREPDANPAQAIFLDGSNTTGLKTFGIAGGNGYAFESGAQTDEARPIYFTNYKMDQVDVKVTGKNFVDLNIDTIKNVTVNVGDGTANNEDLINGSVTLLDATALTINTTDNNAIAKSSTPFQAEVYAAKANNLTLGTSQGSEIEITGGDLSAVSNVAVSGYSDVTIDEAAALGANAGSLRITNTQIGGVFTADLAGNSAGNSSLTYSGSSTNQVNLTLDQNYSSVNITTGVRDDVLTLTVNPEGQISSGTLKGTLGEGNDTVIVNSSTGSWTKASLDFSGLAGVEKIQLNGLTTQDARALVANGSIKLAEGMTAGEVYGDYFAPSDAEIEPGVNYGNGGVTTFKGTLDTSEDVTIKGNSATGDAGGAKIEFGGKNGLNITNVGDLTINGGSDTNSITGTPTNITGDFIVNDAKGTAADTINLTGISATGKVEIIAPEAGMKNAFTATVAQAGADININTNGAASSTIGIVQPATGNVTVAAQGEGKDAVTLDKFEASKLEQTLTITLNDKAQDTVTVADGTDLTGWTTSITGAAITLAGKANLGDLSGITDSTISGGTLQLSGDLDLTKSSLNITSGVDIADGATVKVGSGFAASSVTGGTKNTGVLEIAGGTADDPAALTGSISVQVQVDNGKFVSTKDLANFTGGIEGQEGATAANAGTVIVTGTSNAVVLSDLNVQVADGAVLSVAGNKFGVTDGFDPFALSGAGALKITTTDVTLNSTTPVIGTATLTIDDSITVSVAATDFATAITSDTIDGKGTLKFTGNGTANIFSAGEDAATFGDKLHIAVDTGATVNIGDVDALKTWVDQAAPNSISGAGTVQFAGAADLSAFTNLPIANTATLSTAGGDITLGANIGGTPDFNLAGANNIIVDLDKGADANTTTDLSGITVTNFTGDVEVSLDGKDSVTLSNGNDIVTFNSTSADVANGTKVASFAAANDKIALAGELAGFSYGADSKITTAVTDTPSAIGDPLANYKTLIDNTIYSLTDAGATADTAANIAKYFTERTDGKATTTTANQGVLYLAADTDVVLAIKGADATTTNLWLVQNDATATVAADEITLIGVVGGLGVDAVAATVFESQASAGA
jgi:hypothetical protein